MAKKNDQQGPGRPPSGKPVQELRAIRVLKADWVRWQKRAKKLGQSVSERIRQLMNEDCEK